MLIFQADLEYCFARWNIFQLHLKAHSLGASIIILLTRTEHVLLPSFLKAFYVGRCDSYTLDLWSFISWTQVIFFIFYFFSYSDSCKVQPIETDLWRYFWFMVGSCSIFVLLPSLSSAHLISMFSFSSLVIHRDVEASQMESFHCCCRFVFYRGT